MVQSSPISIQQLIETLLDSKKRFSPKYLYRLSDLDEADLQAVASSWTRIPLKRRQALMEDIETLSAADPLLSYEGISRLAIKDENPHIRKVGIRCLWESEEQDLADQFLFLLDTDESAEVRPAAASALGKYVYLGELDEIPLQLQREIENRLLAKMKSEDAAPVKRSSLEALGFSGREEINPLIESAYFSGNEDWIISSLYAMGRSANDKWHSLVEAMFDHENPEVRLEAARAAGELEFRGSVDKLSKLLEDPDNEVRMAAIWSLSQIGGEEVREALELLYNQTEDDEELQQIESALDNLDFTDGGDLFAMLEIPEADDDLSYEDGEYYEDDEDFAD